jgi:putative heme-binding domain-containing protein
MERQAKDEQTLKTLRTLAQQGKPATTRLHALWTLEGLQALDVALIERCLQADDAGLREQGLRLAEPYLDKAPQVKAAVLALANDPNARVRFQLAFTLGSMRQDPGIGAILGYLARKDGTNPWHQAAILSSASPYADTLLHELAHLADTPPSLLSGLAGLLAASGNQAAIDQAILTLLDQFRDRPGARQLVALEALAQGLARRRQPLAQRMAEKSDPAERFTTFFKQVAQLATAEQANRVERHAAIRLLGHAPLATAAPVLQKLLAPQTASELQLVAVQTLATMPDPQVVPVLLAGWTSYSPAVRREVQEALFARPNRLPGLLTAIEKGQVLAAQLDLARREQLLKHPNAEVRAKAQTVFAGQVLSERKKVVEEHQAVLDLQADAARGKAVFKKHCATCHRLENEGYEVGPDLLSALRNKTKETLLLDMLDPSREADPRYLNYIVSNQAGRIFTGLIASETASSLVLRRAEKAEDTLLRADIEQIQSTAKSLMPEGLEKQMTPQELADVIAYVQEVAGRK